jgi:hypothetical protein
MYSGNRALNAIEAGTYTFNRSLNAIYVGTYSCNRALNTTEVGTYSCNRALNSTEITLYVCTVHFVEFYYIFQQMHNIYLKNLFIKALLHVSMFVHHPLGVSYYVC